MIKIVFFGSSSDSVLVLEKLSGVVAVVTRPPKPVGRKQIITPTPVETWAKNHAISVTTLEAVNPFKPDLLVSASYGEKIPAELIAGARFGGLNVHPSILPRWRGGDPVPWAILAGDHQTGVTISTLSDTFDAGNIIAQKKIPITSHDTTPLLRAKLFAIGADLVASIIPKLPLTGTPQQSKDQPYARRLTREDGFEPWEKLTDPHESDRINRKFRAFHPWPGLWSLKDGKRIKILEFTHTPVTVQLEGKKPKPYLPS